MQQILILGHTLKIGGSERVLSNLMSLLVSMGKEVHFVPIRNAIELPIPDEVIVHSSPIPRWVRTKFIYEKLYGMFVCKLNRKHNFDMVFSNFLTVRRWLPEALESRTYYYLHFDYIIPYQKMLSMNKKSARKLKEKLFKYYNGRNIIAVSNGAGNSLTKNFPITPRKLVTLYNFFDFDEIRKKSMAYSPSIDKPYIIHVGRFDINQKRQDILLKAFELTKTDCQLVLLTQPCAELNSLLSSCNKKHSVRIIPFCKNPYPWIQSAELLVLSSDFEALPMVVVEALVCDTPVVSTNCPSGPSEILRGDFSRWLVSCNNPKALARKIDEALQAEITVTSELLDPFSFSSAKSTLCKILKGVEK